LDPSGKLKVRTACTSCVVHSALDPRVVYTMVVCSVCRGTGREPEAKGAHGKQEASGWSYALVTPLMIVVLALAVFSGIAFERSRTRLKDEAELFQREKVLRPGGAWAEDVKQRVEIGMDTDVLKDELGEPDSVKLYQEGFENGMELWTYRCRDQPVWVSVQAGKVKSVR
jgi:hypothetical protein